MAIEQLPHRDMTLLAGIQQGNVQSIALLYDCYSSVVYSIALRVLQDQTLAERILLDIFTEIWAYPERLMQITGGLSLSLAMIARNRAAGLRLGTPTTTLDVSLPSWVIDLRRPELTRIQACAAIEKLPIQRRLMLERALFGRRDSPPASEGAATPMAEQRSTEGTIACLAGTGLEVIDVQNDPAFARRRLHIRDSALHIDGMNRLASLFVQSPSTILQELVRAATELCGADSAGISIEQKDGTDDDFYHWIATAGEYSSFLDAKLPRYPSACGVTLERGRPQIFRVHQQFFDAMGIQAPVVTDGLLLPWQVDDTRGTIWIMAHGRDEAFDSEDCRLMQALANFAATGVRLQQQQKLLLEQERAAAKSALANDLAHQINNPLQGVMQNVFLFGRGGEESGVFAQQAMEELVGLSRVVNGLLSLPR